MFRARQRFRGAAAPVSPVSWPARSAVVPLEFGSPLIPPPLVEFLGSRLLPAPSERFLRLRFVRSLARVERSIAQSLGILHSFSFATVESCILRWYRVGCSHRAPIFSDAPRFLSLAASFDRRRRFCFSAFVQYVAFPTAQN